MTSRLKISIIQEDLVWEQAPRNRILFEERITRLSPETDLIVLPEMFSTGFSMNAASLAEPVEGPTFSWMQRMAVQKDAAITGSVITEENGQYFNRLYFVMPDGSYKKYDKRHTFTLAGEHETYASGNEKLVLSFRGWKICPLICYDLRFPVWARNTEDYDLLIYVANWPHTRISAWDTLLQARAIENLSYCVGVNRVGEDGNGLHYTGHSAVYDCLGNRTSSEEGERSFAEEVILDKLNLAEMRDRLRFLQDRDDFTLL